MKRLTNVFTTNAHKWNTDKMLEKIGDRPVTEIELCRDPISPVFDTVIDTVSSGKWDELKEKGGVDNFFHLYAIITVDGQKYILEKNANIDLYEYDGKKQPTLMMKQPVHEAQPLNHMLDNTRWRMGDDRFYTYDPFENNCQDFLLNFETANGLVTPEAHHFIKQDITEIKKELPTFTKKLGTAVTTIGHAIGAGEEQAAGKVGKHPWRVHLALVRKQMPHMTMKEAMRHASTLYRRRS